MRFTANEERALLDRAGLRELVSTATLDEIRARYAEPTRIYHDWNHALFVLSWVNHVCEAFPDAALAPYAASDLRLAAIFHDVIYDEKGAPANEERSARFLSDRVAGAGRGGELILATAKHGQLRSDDVPLAVALFLDCDIANFGEMLWEVVRWNDDNVSREMLQRLAPEQVAAVRTAYFAHLLARPSIYLSDYFRERLESQARRNVERLASVPFSASSLSSQFGQAGGAGT